MKWIKEIEMECQNVGLKFTNVNEIRKKTKKEVSFNYLNWLIYLYDFEAEIEQFNLKHKRK